MSLMHYSRLLSMLSMINKFGSEEQKKRWLPKLASGRVRLQSFAVQYLSTLNQISSAKVERLNFVIGAPSR